jgi:hypothetical protein
MAAAAAEGKGFDEVVPGDGEEGMAAAGGCA